MEFLRPHPSHRNSHRARAGIAMVWFAVFLFALFPLAALVVDYGLVTLTRRQMQTAVNTAALEGLRFRDDPSVDDAERRQKVKTLVSTLYDDDLDPLNGDAMNFGAGPIIAVEDGVNLDGTDFYANQKINVANSSAYKPDLKLNADDDPSGDMVAGKYLENAGTHLEGDDYTRDDFTPGDAANDAFLVRLRRSNEAFSGEEVSPVATSGPTIPFLFGRGGITAAVDDPDGPAALWNRRARGTIVRATAIAQTRPAMSVGVASTNVPYGIAAYRFKRGDWEIMPFDSDWSVQSIQLDGNGQLTCTLSNSNSPQTMINANFVDWEPISTDSIERSPTSLGLRLDDAPDITKRKWSLFPADGSELSPVFDPYQELDSDKYRFAPITETIGTSGERIVGFGCVIYSGATTTLRKVKPILFSNATSVWIRPPADLSPSEMKTLFEKANSFPEPLLAPALQRTIP